MLGEILYLSFIVHASETEGKAPLLHLKLPYQKKTKKKKQKKTLESYTPRLEAIFLNIYEWKKRFEEVLMKIFVRVSMCVCAQSCPTLCGLTDCRSPGSSVQGILQAKIPEWVAISYSRESS